MKIENIGFYTLSDERAKKSSITTKLYRCELILTKNCNFNCTYCRGVGENITYKQAEKTLQYWIDEGLKNVRFSGGEPTLFKGLDKLVSMCEDNNVERIAISTNGSANRNMYDKLIDCGVSDFSISLDSCCAGEADKISGKNGSWKKVCENIKYLSKKVYTTVGIVINKDNIHNCNNTIRFADSLGVSDIRIIPSAQFNKILYNLSNLDSSLLDKYPILKYRYENICKKRHVRGITENDSKKCGLVLDDMAVMGEYHYPCIIYMREGGSPIGKVCENMRQKRKIWMESHNSFEDDICKKNCLDVCIDFNNSKEY